LSEPLDPALIAMLGYQPNDPVLFTEALTHGSLSTRGSMERDYQRLEFLGDRVLGLVIATELYKRFPDEPEGKMSSRLNGLVSRETCAEVGRVLNLGPLIRLGKQARDDGARDSENVLGDVVESLIGALYLDGGLGVAERFILAGWDSRMTAVTVAPKHPKSALLEWAAANRRRPPEYRLVRREGPDHAPRFVISASITNVGEAEATGTSKQDAESAAAAALMAQLEARA
jgi:ribonuclease III